MPASQPSYPATPDTSHPAFSGSTNQFLTFGDVGGWGVNNGVGIGTPTVMGTSASTSNSLGNALVFNGTNTYVKFPITNVPFTEFTLLFGGEFNSFTNFGGLADCTSGSTGWNIFQASGGVLWYSANGYSGVLNSSSWPTSTVVHGALRSKTGQTCDWYRNGTKLGSTTSPVPNTPIVDFWIGNQRGGGIMFIAANLNYYYLFDKYLSDSVIASIASDPYAIFVASGGGTTYTITPSGGIIFSGGISTYKEKILNASGGLKMAGNAIVYKQKILSPSGSLLFNGNNQFIKEKLILPSGVLSFSGSSNAVKEKVIPSSGNITFSGTASLSGAATYIITPSGGINFSGTGVMFKSHLIIPSGNIVFSGHAPMSSNTVIAKVSTRLPLVGVGQ